MNNEQKTPNFEMYAERRSNLDSLRSQVENAAKTFKEAGESLTSDPTKFRTKSDRIMDSIWDTLGSKDLKSLLESYFQAITEVTKAHQGLPVNWQIIVSAPPEM